MANTGEQTFPYLLKKARERKRWTQLQLAVRLGVTTITVSRWENAHTFPHLSEIDPLCNVLGKKAEELGLGESVPRGKISSPVAQSSNQKLWYSSLTTRLFEPVVNTVHVATKDLCQLQAEIDTVLEEANLMESTNPNYHITRREALTCLATFPQITLFNESINILKSSVTARVLKECAGGIAACDQLRQGSYDDMALAHQALSSYAPALETIVQHSSQYRGAAALLAYQCFNLKAGTAYYFEGTKQEVACSEQAVIYAKESGVRVLYISALRHLAASYFDDRDYAQALRIGQKAAYLLTQSGSPTPPLLKSWVHAGLIRYQAREKVSGVEGARKLAYDTFSQEAASQEEEHSDFSLHSYANIIRQDAMAHLYMREPSQALQKFGQILDFGSGTDEQVKPKLVVPQARYGYIVNEAALVSLKVPSSEKDKGVSIRLWKAGWQAAKEFRNEEGFQQAIQAYEIMESLWPNETDVQDLGDLVEDYVKGKRRQG